MFVFPIHHSSLTVRRFPFATVALIGVNLSVFAVSSAFPQTDWEAVDRVRDDLLSFHDDHDYLELPADFAQTLDEPRRALYEMKSEWLAWYAANPDEAAARIDEILAGSSVEAVLAAEKTTLASWLSQPAQAVAGAREEAAERLEEGFLVRVSMVDDADWDAASARLDRLMDDLRATTSTIDFELGYAPAKPRLLGLVAHTFYNPTLIRLVLSMIILWIAGAMLEDVWSWHTVSAAYVVFGVFSALLCSLIEPHSASLILGSTGAVAGLMGAFIVRLTREQIKFAYFFWVSLKPKFGVFEAPSFVVIPMWLLTEGLVYLFAEERGFRFWPYAGGLFLGAIVAVVFRLIDFERRVLHKEPRVKIAPEDLPLVAFQSAATEKHGQGAATRTDDP